MIRAGREWGSLSLLVGTQDGKITLGCCLAVCHKVKHTLTTTWNPRDRSHARWRSHITCWKRSQLYPHSPQQTTHSLWTGGGVSGSTATQGCASHTHDTAGLTRTLRCGRRRGEAAQCGSPGKATCGQRALCRASEHRGNARTPGGGWLLPLECGTGYTTMHLSETPRLSTMESACMHET